MFLEVASKCVKYNFDTSGDDIRSYPKQNYRSLIRHIKIMYKFDTIVTRKCIIYDCMKIRRRIVRNRIEKRQFQMQCFRYSKVDAIEHCTRIFCKSYCNCECKKQTNVMCMRLSGFLLKIYKFVPTKVP